MVRHRAADVVAKAEVDAAKQSVGAAEYNVKSNEASLKQAEDNLKKTTIFAGTERVFAKNWFKEIIQTIHINIDIDIYSTVYNIYYIINWTFFYQKGNFFCIHGNSTCG